MSRHQPAVSSPPTEAELKVIRSYSHRPTKEDPGKSYQVIAAAQEVTDVFVEYTLAKYEIHYREDARAFLAEHDLPRGEAAVSTTTAPTMTKPPRLPANVLEPNGAHTASPEPESPVGPEELAAGLDALDLDELAEALSASVDSTDEATRSTAAMLLGLAANLTSRVAAETQTLRDEVTAELDRRRRVLRERHTALRKQVEAVALRLDALTDSDLAVRAWAELAGVACPMVGAVPPRLVKAWLASLPEEE